MICLFIYAVSFALPVFSFKDFDGMREMSGAEAFVFGMLATLGGGGTEGFVWSANVAFLFSMVIIQRSRLVTVLALLAMIPAFYFLHVEEVLAAEDGRTAAIIDRQVGYYCWLAAITLWAFYKCTAMHKKVIKPDTGNY